MTKISKANASKLALMIGYKSIEDEIKVVKKNYIDLSTACKPVHEKFCEAMMNMPELWQMNFNQSKVEVIKGKILPQEAVFNQQKYARDLVNDVMYNSRSLNMKDAVHINSLFPKDDVIEYENMTTGATRIECNLSFREGGKEVFGVYRLRLSTKYKLSHFWPNIPMNFHKNVKVIRSLQEKYTKFSNQLERNFSDLCQDLLEQITVAGTVKNLLKHWPECEPLVDLLGIGTPTTKDIEVPLGNIILRHLKALPQAEA
tara:strand:- start:11704 stop:12477 length:774 start_codon:yes stop_codon:yes gene_type:complete